MPPQRRDVHVTINLNVFLPPGGDDDHTTNEEHEQIMAKIDEVQGSFDELDRAVRDFMAQGAPNVDALQAELDALRADDAIEDTKLDGMKNGIDNLRQAVDALRSASGDDQPHPDQTLPGDLE